jgi:hypothetical protein
VALQRIEKVFGLKNWQAPNTEWVKIDPVELETQRDHGLIASIYNRFCTSLGYSSLSSP